MMPGLVFMHNFHMSRNRTPEPNFRGISDVFIGALAGSALVPFIEAFVGRAGEEFYNSVRSRFTKKTDQQIVERTGSVPLADQAIRTVIRLPINLTPEESAALAALRLPPQTTAWRIIYWDSANRVWTVQDQDDEPTRNVIRLDDPTED